MLNQLLSKSLRLFGMGILLFGLTGCDMNPDSDGNSGGGNGGNDVGNDGGGNDGGDNGDNDNGGNDGGVDGGNDGGNDNGGNDGGDNAGSDDGQNAGETELTTITFEAASGFPEDDTELTFEVDGREIGFAGGFAIRRGIPALYGEGSRSWMINSSVGPGRIDLTGLNVVKARFFWGRLEGEDAALVVFTDSNDDTSQPIEAIAVPVNDAMVEIESPVGTTIERLDFVYLDGVADDVECALDSLTLTVTE